MRRVLRLLRQERGYSLVELLTVMVIMSVVLGGLTQLFVSGSNAEVDMNRRFQAQQAARVAMDRLRRDIHCSSAAVPPTATPPAASTVLTLTDPCVSGGYVSWCTVSSVGPGGATWYSLYRKLAATCDNTGSDYADSLVNPSGFYAASPTATEPCPPGVLQNCNYYGFFPEAARAVPHPQVRSEIAATTSDCTPGRCAAQATLAAFGSTAAARPRTPAYCSIGSGRPSR